MHADLQRWNIFQPRDCVRKLIAVRDDRTGRHDAVAMRFDCPGGHPAIEADVIRGHDQLFKRAPHPPLRGTFSRWEKDEGSSAPLPSGEGGAERRVRGLASRFRISGYNLTSSAKILKMTFGDDKCDLPRILGK